MADRVTNRAKTFDVDSSSSEEWLPAKGTNNQSTPRMTQEKKASSTSSTSTYPHSTSNIKDDVKKDIEKTIIEL